MSDTPTNPTETPETSLEQVPCSPQEPPGKPVDETAETSTPQAPPPGPPAEQTEPPTDGQPPAEAQPPKPTLQTGRVLRVTAEYVLIGLDEGREGTVPLIDFAGQPLPLEGDEVSVIIESEDPRTGKLVLSKRHADELTFWQSVQPGLVLEGVVTGMNKGGLDIDIGGARAFLPSSQVDVRRMRDISTLIGEHVRCVVTQVDRTTHDLIVSRKKFIEEERKQERRKALSALIEGEVMTGAVTNVTDYGAFIDLNGVAGLLHQTDMSWGRITNPKEVVQTGQQLRVRILKVNRDTGKVSLGLKQLKPNPWDGIEERYPKDKRIKAKVVRMADFGAFLELEDGLDALLPLSEMSWSRQVGRPSDIVKIGEEIEVVVLKVDPKKRRISVGLKQIQENPWASVTEKFPPNSKTTGKVSKIMEFGAFVEIAPGVEGLIHISELSEGRVRSVEDVVKEGQEVETRVIKIDEEAQRISLSMRPERKAPPAADLSSRKPNKKRKKPLRGGLASHFEW